MPPDALRDIHPAIRREATFGEAVRLAVPSMSRSRVGTSSSSNAPGSTPGDHRPHGPNTWRTQGKSFGSEQLRTGARSIRARRDRCLDRLHVQARCVHSGWPVRLPRRCRRGGARATASKTHEVANPDVLDPRNECRGEVLRPTQGAFASELAAYYVKYQSNVHARSANTWPDPHRLALCSCPVSITVRQRHCS